jgi:hypothetical protein
VRQRGHHLLATLAGIKNASARRFDTHRQHARDMQCTAAGAIMDLVPARGAIGDDQRVGFRLAHSRQQRQFALSDTSIVAAS